MVFYPKKAGLSHLKQARLSKEYVKVERLGEGTYATVFKVLDPNGLTFALKEETITDAGDFGNESKLLALLRHPSIVNLYEYGRQEGRNVLVLEYVGGGSLHRELSRSNQPAAEGVIRERTRQILEALEYCHSFGVVHRDVKASNVLVTEAGRLKLADFGGSKRGPSTLSEEALKASQNMQMTLLWAAPEQLRDLYSCKSDIWSLGCTVIEMATLRRPWADVNFQCEAAIPYFLMNQKAGPPVPDYLSPEAKDFLQLCFTWEYSKRPSASELLQHPWIRQQGLTSVASVVSSASSVEEPQGPSDSPRMGRLTLSEETRETTDDTSVKISWLSDSTEANNGVTSMDSTLYTPPKRITEEEMAAILAACP